MNQVLLIALVVAPAIPGVVSLVRAFRHRDPRAATRAIRWGALCAVIAAVIFVVNAVRVFGTMTAVAPPEEKATVLSAGLLPVQRAVSTGVAAGMVLGLLGGIARGLAGRSERGGRPSP